MGRVVSSAGASPHDGRGILPFLMKKGSRKPICLNGHPASMRNVRGQCNGCRSIYNVKYHGKYREKEHARHKVYAQTPAGRMKNIRNGANQRGISFDLTMDQFMAFWQKPCIYGCVIETIGLDRIDNTKGYSVENCQPLCYAHNQMKMDRTAEDFIEKCRMVVAFYSK